MVALDTREARRSLILTIPLMVVMAIGPTPVSASANACIDLGQPMPSFLPPLVPVAGAWATWTSLGTSPTCGPGYEFFMPSAACGAAGTSPGPAVYCGPVVPAGVALPPIGACTASYLGNFPGWTVSLLGGISVIGIAAGWDYTGPFGAPDGHVDDWDAGPLGFSIAVAIGPPGPTYSTVIGAPVAAGPAQLIAWPMATDTMPPGLSALLGERVHVGCI